MSNWQPIETAPKNVRVMVFIPADDECPDGLVEIDVCHSRIHRPSGNHVGWELTGLLFPEPTHWMPLPSHPDAEPEVWKGACISQVLSELPKKVREQIPESVRLKLACLVTPPTNAVNTSVDEWDRKWIDGVGL